MIVKSQVNGEGHRRIVVSSSGGVETLQIHLNDIQTPTNAQVWINYHKDRLEAKAKKQSKKKSAVRDLTSKQIDELIKG